MSKVRVLVTGSRTWELEDYLRQVFEDLDIELGSDVEKVLVSGNCPQGADILAEEVCKTLGWTLELHPADWTRHGKAAGFIRNKVMVETNPLLLVAFIQDGSKGAGHTVRLAKTAGVPTRKYSRTGKGEVEFTQWPDIEPEDTNVTLW